MTWSAAFDTPIALPDGRELATLLEAGEYIAALPKATQQRPEWQAATEALILVAERDGPAMLARIGVMRALNSGRPAPPVLRKKQPRSVRLIR